MIRKQMIKDLNETFTSIFNEIQAPIDPKDDEY